MKMAIMSLMVLASTSSFAVTKKVCFETKGPNSNGSRFVMTITKKEVVISNGSGEMQGQDGKYKANGTLNGRDGKTYLSYFISSIEGSNDLLVEESLLKAGTTGLAKSRWRGESFGETKYVCRDDKF